MLSEPVDYHQDRGVASGVRELLDEVHGDGVPGSLGDRELLQSTVGEMPGNFSSRTGSTGLTVVPDEESKSGPGVVPQDQGLRLVLSPVSGSRMVVTSSEYAKAEVAGVRDIDST